MGSLRRGQEGSKWNVENERMKIIMVRKLPKTHKIIITETQERKSQSGGKHGEREHGDYHNNTTEEDDISQIIPFSRGGTGTERPCISAWRRKG